MNDEGFAPGKLPRIDFRTITEEDYEYEDIRERLKLYIWGEFVIDCFILHGEVKGWKRRVGCRRATRALELIEKGSEAQRFNARNTLKTKYPFVWYPYLDWLEASRGKQK